MKPKKQKRLTWRQVLALVRQQPTTVARALQVYEAERIKKTR
jgi:hypothetical protein